MPDETLTADGFSEAFIGYIERCGENPVAIYDREKCIAILIKRDRMTEDEAVEFFDFNVEGSWVGRGTPGFLYRLPLGVFQEMMKD